MASGGARLRVLHVVALAGAGGEFGGPVSVAEQDARELGRRGHEVIVAALHNERVEPPEGIAPDRWRTFKARRVVPGWGMLGLSSWGLTRFLWRTTRCVDVVHIHAGRDLVSLTALVTARLRGATVVAQTHGMVRPRTALVTRIFDGLFLRLLGGAASVLFLTDSERAELRSLLGAKVDLTFVANGIALPAPRSALDPDAVPQVLFLARLHPVKRVVAFVEAAALLSSRGVAARFVVHGPDQGELRAMRDLIDAEGLADVVHYGGALSHPAAIEALSASAVFVLPSLVEWMPMSLIEALALGVPSVCTKTCGIADVLSDADAAVVTDGSPGQLADAVARILADDAEADRLSRSAREVVSKVFAISAVVDELEAVYARAIGAARAKRQRG